MTIFGWLLAHHILSVLVGLAAAGLALSVLGQRRPTGSAFAWILVILLVPYLGVPLYLTFGGRKIARRARSKSLLPPLAGGGSSAIHGIADTTATKVTWLDDGVVAYQTFLHEIETAKRSIRIVTFVLGDDPTGRSLMAALILRAKAGVEVTLLLDDFLRFHAPHGLLRDLERAGGRLGRFMPLLHIPFRGRGNLRNHRKIAVFDDERAIVGGMNLADEYMGPSPSETRWRDLSMMVTGEVVERLNAIFEADWEFASSLALPKAETGGATGEIQGVPLRVVPSGPDTKNDPIYDALLSAAFRAEKRFWVSTPYFIPDEPLVRALTIAARRGVDVRIFTPLRSNHLLADLAAGPLLRELAEEGVVVWRHRTMLHAKAVLVDDTLGMVGSANFDMRSLFLDYEVALFLSGPAEVAELSRWFGDRERDSERGVNPVGWVRERVELVARLLAPLL
jgi:cardiolipin synthase A/B